MEYGTILVATAEPEETLMILFEDRSWKDEKHDGEHQDWNVLMLSGGEKGRVVWVPDECLSGDDPTYVEAPR